MSTTAATVDETTRLYLAVGRLSRILRRSGSPGLGQGSISALATLAYKGPMRLGDLAAREGVAPPTLSRIIAALVESGYVMREADPQDGRASLVRATPAGEQIIAGVRSERLHELHNRLERLTDEQRAALAAAVPALEALVAEDV